MSEHPLAYSGPALPAPEGTALATVPAPELASSPGARVSLWRTGDDCAGRLRGAWLYVGMFLLWPLAAALAGLIGLPLAWLLGFDPVGVFAAGFALAAALLQGWSVWEHSARRARKLAERDGRYRTLGAVSDLATLPAGTPVRLRGWVRPDGAGFASALAGRAGADESDSAERLPMLAAAPAAVYETVRARQGWLEDGFQYQLGCDFELVDETGAAVSVRLGGATVMSHRRERATVRDADAVAEILGRVHPHASPERLREQAGDGLAVTAEVIRVGDWVEVMGTTGHRLDRATPARESAQCPVIGHDDPGHDGLPTVVIGLGPAPTKQLPRADAKGLGKPTSGPETR